MKKLFVMIFCLTIFLNLYATDEPDEENSSLQKCMFKPDKVSYDRDFIEKAKGEDFAEDPYLCRASHISENSNYNNCLWTRVDPRIDLTSCREMGIKAFCGRKIDIYFSSKNEPDSLREIAGIKKSTVTKIQLKFGKEMSIVNCE